MTEYERHYSNYSNGYIVELVPVNGTQCESWILLPAENLWPAGLRGTLYLIAMFYIFIGIAIISDIFMCSIEVITSKQKTIIKYDPERKVQVKKEVLVWNETVANLTLMALGSSAPEILLSTVETLLTITDAPDGKDSLGTFTIIGSGAFNLLIITAMCVVSVPSPDIKRIKEFGVFIVTAVWSIFAYVWILIVVLWSSRGVVELWEAWVTLAFLPILVFTAYCQDCGWWCKRGPSVGNDPNCESSLNVRVINGGAKKNTVFHGPSRQLQALEAEKTQSQLNLKTATEEKSNGNDMVLRDLEAGTEDNRPLYLEEEKQQFARARSRFRHAVVRSMIGGKKHFMAQRIAAGGAVGNQPRLLALVDKVQALQKSSELAMSDDLKGKFTFALPNYTVLESAGKLEISVLFHRATPKRRAQQFPKENGWPAGRDVVDETSGIDHFGDNAIKDTVYVSYETRDGTAKKDTEFTFTQGQLCFKETEWKKTITIPIINDNQYENDMEFYVILKSPEGGGVLGDPSVTRVTIIDDDVPGEFSFESPTYTADLEKGVVSATVTRTKGFDGTVTLQYATMDGTAKGDVNMDGGADYKSMSGTLCFKHEEKSKTIEVPVNKESMGLKNFVIVLRNPSVGAKLGEHSAAVANLRPDDIGERVANILDDDEEDTETWFGQIKNAMTLGGDLDDDGKEVPPSKRDCLMHFITFFWKVLFAFVPPKNYAGGWPAFFGSLLIILGLTALVQQLGNLLGCVLNIEPSVAGITIIAFGTSVPDAFASRTAAIQDQHADAAIGNITGSNSVNVFLGLGLPWVIRTMYLHFQNVPFAVGTENLDLSVILFTSVGMACIVILIARRFVLGGELGGKKLTKYLTGWLLVLLWFVYIIIASLRAYKII